MKLSITRNELLKYLTNQVNNFFPDKYHIEKDFDIILDSSLERLDYCFKHVKSNRYFKNSESLYNHLYADHNVMLLWFLSNTAWQKLSNTNLASKLYYLNKSLHGVDCMYDTKMPDIFLIFHGVGTMLGKADYNDFFVVLHGCTVGSHKGKYPTFGKGVSLAANSSVIGDCNIGNRAVISTRTTVFKKTIPYDNTAFFDFDKGELKIQKSQNCYTQQFFNWDLTKLD